MEFDNDGSAVSRTLTSHCTEVDGLGTRYYSQASTSDCARTRTSRRN